MEQQALQAFSSLCEKLGEMIDASVSRMQDLENKIKALECRQATTYTQRQVADITGWSVAAINKWLSEGLIQGVPVKGKKNLAIPASEIDTIIAQRGYGKKQRRAPR